MRLFPALSAIACLMPLLSWAGPVNINTADASTLAKELKGVGAARAQAIIAYRTQHGPFKSADDLTLVKGIAQKVVDDNRENIRIETERGASAPVKRPPAAARTP